MVIIMVSVEVSFGVSGYWFGFLGLRFWNWLENFVNQVFRLILGMEVVMVDQFFFGVEVFDVVLCGGVLIEIFIENFSSWCGLCELVLMVVSLILMRLGFFSYLELCDMLCRNLDMCLLVWVILLMVIILLVWWMVVRQMFLGVRCVRLLSSCIGVLWLVCRFLMVCWCDFSVLILVLRLVMFLICVFRCKILFWMYWLCDCCLDVRNCSSR